MTQVAHFLIFGKITQEEVSLSFKEQKAMAFIQKICSFKRRKKTNEQKFKFIFSNIYNSIQEDFLRKTSRILKAKNKFINSILHTKEHLCQSRRHIFCDKYFFSEQKITSKNSQFQKLFQKFYFPKFPEFINPLKKSQSKKASQKLGFNQKFIKKAFEAPAFKSMFLQKLE